MATKTLGEVGYERYGEAGGWRTFDGRPIPQWMELGESRTGLETRRRWEEASVAIVEASNRGARPGPKRPREDEPAAPPPPVDRSAQMTLGGTAIGEHLEIKSNGQQKDYIVLTDEERAKGFVRPVRRSYRHLGRRPKHPTRPLTDEEAARHGGDGFVLFEEYPTGGSCAGRFWTEAELKSGCGSVTTMGEKIAETYARDPTFYGGTFCCACRAHFPVGKDGEFVWEGTDERVGT